MKRDTAYLQQHREKLLELYPEQWVAIFDEQVVGVAPEFDHLLDSLQARGVPVGQVLIEHLTRKEGLLILLE
ncbi:MAG: hypothetical protein HYU88_13860 [Chloroflexi bacterium]|nr:hypothetical protein [Chloroflexota bacterium]MBI4504934.1 hypothetical protein [Chloroflexota bacterium]